MKLLRNIYPIVLGIYLLTFMVPFIPKVVHYIAAGITVLFSFCFLSNRNSRSKALYLKWLFAFVLFAGLSLFWAIKPGLGFNTLKNFLLYIIILTSSVYLYIRKADDIRTVLGVYYVSAIIMAIILVSILDITELEGTRLMGAMMLDDDEMIWNSNYFGVHISFAMYSGIIVFWNTGRNKLLIRSLLITISLFFIAIVLLSGSRGALMALAMPIVGYYIQKKHFLKNSIIVTVCILILYWCVMNIPILYSNIGNRVEETMDILSGKDTGDMSRIYLFRYGLQWFLDNPVLGVGLNNFRCLSSSSSLFYGRDFYAHNNYIELLVDIGLIGTCIYYSYVYLLLKKSKQNPNRMIIVSMLFTVLAMDISHVSYYESIIQLTLCITFCMLKTKEQLISFGNQSKIRNKR